jgi:hypothetical protein
MKRSASCHIEQSRPSLQQFSSVSHVFPLRHRREAVARAVVPGPAVSTLVVSMLVARVPAACVPVA